MGETCRFLVQHVSLRHLEYSALCNQEFSDQRKFEDVVTICSCFWRRAIEANKFVKPGVNFPRSFEKAGHTCSSLAAFFHENAVEFDQAEIRVAAYWEHA